MFRARHVSALWWTVACLTVLTACAVPEAPPPGHHPPVSTKRVWIDTDAACINESTFTDPDDCVALAFAERAGLNIAGISLTAGNATIAVARRSVAALNVADHTPVLDGGGACDSAAVQGLAAASANRPLTILALGPLTNIAAFARCYPDRIGNVRRVIAVMGRRPGQVFKPTPESMVLHDMNFERDPSAVRMAKAHFAMRYVPYEAGVAVQVPARYAAAVSPPAVRGKLFRWTMLVRQFWGTAGMPQFDVTAAAAFAWPDLFECRPVQTRIHDARLVAYPHAGRENNESYCTPRNNNSVISAIFGNDAISSIKNNY